MARILKLITFDATETLMIFKPPVAQVYTECAKKFGISVETEDVLKNFKVQWKTLSKSHPNFGRHSGLGWKAWWTQIVVNTFKSAAPSSDEKTLAQLADFLINEYQTNRCWALADGTLDILNFLKMKNISIGVISNYDERLENTLKALEIHSYFNFILTSYSAGVMKPDKKIFDLAMSQIQGNILPENCSHVGNSLQFDYLGAKNAGWQPLYVGPIDNKIIESTESCNVCKNLAEVKLHFEQALQISTK